MWQKQRMNGRTRGKIIISYFELKIKKLPRLEFLFMIIEIKQNFSGCLRLRAGLCSLVWG